MTIDLFGRHLQTSGASSVRGPAGLGFKLSAEGNFDIENKRIVNVADPQDETDAVNKKSALIVESDVINVRKKRLIEVADPIDDSDAPNSKYVRLQIDETLASNCLTLDKAANKFQANNKPIRGLPWPTEDTEVAIKKYVDNKNETLKKDSLRLESGKPKIQQNFTAKSKRIIDIKEPIHDTDASNKKYVDDQITELRNVIMGHFEEIFKNYPLLKRAIGEVFKVIKFLILKYKDVGKRLHLKQSQEEVTTLIQDLSGLIQIHDDLFFDLENNSELESPKTSTKPSTPTTSKNTNKNE